MLEDKLTDYLDLITKAAAKAGPQVMQFAVQNERWSGIGDVAIGLFFLLLAMIGLGLACRHVKRLQKMEEPGATICASGGVLGTVALAIACIQLLNIWNWVAVYNPKIALFHDILNDILNKFLNK